MRIRHHGVIHYATTAELDAGLDRIRRAPRTAGRLELIVRRPGIGTRELLDTARLDLDDGLVGDGWRSRGSSRTPDGSANRAAQITLMSSRVAALVAREGPDRWALAGDQLYVDLDLSGDNLPPGAQLAIGSAVLELSPAPHTGCKKFADRFGMDAARFVNSPTGRALRLRGANAFVVVPGEVRVGDVIELVRACVAPA